MKKIRVLSLLALTVLLLAVSATAQTRIMIPAGTPEDRELQAISNESDGQKRIAMLEDFVQKFSSNNAAVAYGNWQLAQQYSLAGDQAKALSYGDKALAAMPEVVDILVSQADTAQQMKAYDKVVDYASRAAVVYHGIAKQAKPADVSDQDWANQIADQQRALQNSYDYLEASGYNALASEQDARRRMQEIEKYMQAFGSGKYTQQSATLAIVTLQEQKDTAGLAAFGDKVLAQNPNNMKLLTVLANAYVSDPSGSYVSKAGTYARKAIELEKSQPAKDETEKTMAGVAHSVLGQVLLRESKLPAAAQELKTAAGLLKGSPQDAAGAWYYLGFTYAKMERASEAIQALTEAAAGDTAYKQPAQDLLNKIRAVRPRAR